MHIVAVVACAVLAWAVWRRRWTLRTTSDYAKLTERTITMNLILQGASLYLMSPICAVDPYLHTIFGHWNLDVFAGHMTNLGACAMLIVHVKSRFDYSIDEIRARFRQRFELPMAVLVPMLLALFVASPNATRHDWPDLLDAPVDGWLGTYWTVLCAYMIYLLVNPIPALFALRVDPRNHRTATVYLVVCFMGAVGLAGLIVSAWLDCHFGRWFWLADSFGAMGLAVSSAYSWQLKVRWLAGAEPRS
jgi:NADH:ubiquinone oxidoreductase subunit 6 (subunit J)